jgi:hypothetical protein
MILSENICDVETSFALWILMLEKYQSSDILTYYIAYRNYKLGDQITKYKVFPTKAEALKYIENNCVLLFPRTLQTISPEMLKLLRRV